MVRHSRIQSGLLTLLDHLREIGLPLAVGTSSGRVYASRLLEGHGLRDRFANVSLDRAEGEREVNMQLTLEVRSRDHLARVLRALRRVPEALRIQRVRALSSPA